ncbi:hypothetical protein [Ferrimonas marina]|uniref:Uncharacterized protein n=1 Tax=Ferrimonas marina TaxID=299255 RepID=A0A1M5U5Q8_9GAMM|nr:hypothetical protein [Ferrimonas marina]SHH58304.1 hypothetical protein SAMN02745129_2419 [Ferrimonas marina]
MSAKSLIERVKPALGQMGGAGIPPGGRYTAVVEVISQLESTVYAHPGVNITRERLIENLGTLVSMHQSASGVSESIDEQRHRDEMALRERDYEDDLNCHAHKAMAWLGYDDCHSEVVRLADALGEAIDHGLHDTPGVAPATFKSAVQFLKDVSKWQGRVKERLGESAPEGFLMERAEAEKFISEACGLLGAIKNAPLVDAQYSSRLEDLAYFIDCTGLQLDQGLDGAEGACVAERREVLVELDKDITWGIARCQKYLKEVTPESEPGLSRN